MSFVGLPRDILGSIIDNWVHSTPVYGTLDPQRGDKVWNYVSISNTSIGRSQVGNTAIISVRTCCNVSSMTEQELLAEHNDSIVGLYESLRNLTSRKPSMFSHGDRYTNDDAHLDIMESQITIVSSNNRITY